MRTEQRGGGAGVAERRVDARSTRACAAPSCLATAAPSRPSGSGSDHARDVERGELLAELAQRRAGRSPRGTGAGRRGRGSSSSPSPR